MTDFRLQNGSVPFAVALDIQGNHFRGVIIGVLLGFALGVAAVAAGALAFLAIVR